MQEKNNITPIRQLVRQQRRGTSPIPADRVITMPKPVKREVCPTCQWEIDDAGHGWRSKGLDPYTKKSILEKCPTCSNGVEGKQQARLINSLFGDAHIPVYAKEWSFANFPSDADQKALAEVKKFVALSLAGKGTKRGLYLVGGVGQCKSSLATSALQSVLKKGRTGVFITTIELFDILRGSIAASRRIEHGDKQFNDKLGREEYFQDKYEESKGAKLLRLLKTAEYLVLDDLGVENSSKYVIQNLYAILEERRSNGLYTIFTSNRNADDLTIYWQSEQGSVFQDGLRIIERIGEYCLVIPVNGKNQRRR